MNSFKINKKVWQDPIYFIGFGFGSGLMPTAPGTWGSLAAFPLYLLLAAHSVTIYLSFTIAAFSLGIWVCDRISRDLGEDDYCGIVWDEIVGYLFTMTLAPSGFIWMILGFLLFRLFDIWKPQPVRFIDERIKGGLGVMLDDVLAAVPAWFIMQLLAWYFVK